MPDYPDHFLACEAFIRRASQLGLPFMLKGSFLTRQYFPNPADRLPQDLDWLALEHYNSGEAARAAFNQWMTLATGLLLDDGIVFRDFRENAFWRMLDYAMDDAFPTISTDLAYRSAGEPAVSRPWDTYKDANFQVDLSFNLPLDLASEPLLYQPLVGEPFIVEHTPPLALQVAWKLHQSLVRARFKDLFDLLHLLRHPDFTPAVREQALAALRQECRADGADVARLGYLLAGQLEPLFTGTSSFTTLAAEQWQLWRHGHQPPHRWGHGVFYEEAKNITDATQLPAALPDFAQQVREAFALAGFTAAQLPELTAAAQKAPTKKQDYYEALLDLLT